MAEGWRRGGGESRGRGDVHEQGRIREGEGEAVVVALEDNVRQPRSAKPHRANLRGHLPLELSNTVVGKASKSLSLSPKLSSRPHLQPAVEQAFFVLAP